MNPDDPGRRPAIGFAALPDPGQAHTLDELIAQLRVLKKWAGDPSYSVITSRINDGRKRLGTPEGAKKNTVADCFRLGRRRPNEHLVLEIVAALHPDLGYAALWRQALRVALGEAEAATLVSAQDAMPHAAIDFVGRHAEIDRIVHGKATTVITGMAGVGKTQLALRAAHRHLHARGSHDVQLFVNLRGFHPDTNLPPASSTAVLGAFLRLLNVPDNRIPPDLAGRIAAYHQRLRNRSGIIVLDNAFDENQIQWLLPPPGTCRTIVTSRRMLTNLDNVDHLRLEVLTSEDAIGFLRTVAGTDQLGGEAEAMARIAHLCGHLPLALGLVAGHIKAHPDWDLADHIDRLTRRRHDLRLESDVQAALDLSYRDLDPPQRQLFRLLALHPGHDLTAHAAAALANVDLNTAQEWLNCLDSEHLLTQRAPTRYELHDLVRAFATTHVDDEDNTSTQRAALTRLFDHYRHTAALAMDTVFPLEQHRRPRVPPSATAVPEVSEPSNAKAWLDVEQANLVAVVMHAAQEGWPDHAIALATTLARFLYTGNHQAAALQVHNHALTAAESINCRHGKVATLGNLGVTYSTLGNVRKGLDYLEQAYANCHELDDRISEGFLLSAIGATQRRLGQFIRARDSLEAGLLVRRDTHDRIGEAFTLTSLGVVYDMLGQYKESMHMSKLALAIRREIGDTANEGWPLQNIGSVLRRLGHYDGALEWLNQALTAHQNAGDGTGQAETLIYIGDVHRQLGNLTTAGEYLEQARALHKKGGDRHGYGEALGMLGLTHAQLGHHDATSQLEQALAIAEEIESPELTTSILNALGQAHIIFNRPANAQLLHQRALDIAHDTGIRYQEARALDGIARSHNQLGNKSAARKYWTQALALYVQLGVPESNVVKAKLQR